MIGDSGKISSAEADDPRWGGVGGQPLTLGRVETIAPDVGGVDKITTGAGQDILLGGYMGDPIEAGEGDNIVLGDNGFVDYVIIDSDPNDIDRIWSTDGG